MPLALTARAAPLPPARGDLGWLRLFIAALATADPLIAAAPGVWAWNLPPASRPSSRGGQYVTGMHQHDFIEVCAAVEGRGILDIRQRRHALPAPALAVINPGVPHSEGFARQRRPYTTVWLSLSGTGLAHVLASRYQPGSGWSCPWSAAFPLPPASGAGQWSGAGRQVTSEDFEAFRGEWLAVLGGLARDLNRAASAGEDPVAGPLAPRHRQVLHWVRHFLDQHFQQPHTLDDIAAMTRYSPKHLDMLFARWTGVGIHGYLTRRRMEQAWALCRDSTVPIKQIALAVGYADPLYFSRAFRRHHGCSPTQARSGG